MKIRMGGLAVATLLSLTGAAQTSNVAGHHQFLVNGVGVGLTGPIPSHSPIGAGLTTTFSGLPNSPIVVAIANSFAANQLVLGPNNSLDIDVPSLTIVLDGTGGFIPSGLAQFLHTNAAGNMAFYFPNAPQSAGFNFAAQSAFFNPAYPTTVQLSAAFNVFDVVDPNLAAGNAVPNPAAALVAGAGDDTTAAISLGGFSFQFYGTTYTTLFACSNGFVSTAAATSFTESAASLVSVVGGAKICAWWDDLNVGGGVAPAHGSLDFYTDGATMAEVTWVNVPEFVNVGAGNSFKITLLPGAVVLDYGSMSSLDGLVGLAPAVGGVAYPINMSLGNQNALPGDATSAPFELFTGTGASVNDLANKQITFILNAAGQPIAMF